MYKFTKLALSTLLPVAALAGCSDWLGSSKVTNYPNAPTQAARGALLVGVGTAQTTLQTGDLARLFSVWTQQMGATDRQYIPLSLYQFDEDAFAADWNLVYTGGGLVDIRSIEAQSIEAGDSTYAGVAKVWEALDMGTAADVWGDIPYSQAVSDSILTPQLDAQQDVYNAVQAQLDTAIRYLACTAPTCFGPVNGEDLWYGGDATKWAALAHTLKARYYMHVAERDPSAYALALAQADSGIASPEDNFVSWQSNDPNEWNLWYQFMVVQRSGYISAGKFMIDTLSQLDDPRLQAYFAPNASGDFVGSAPGGSSGDISTLSDARLSPTFRQPMVTYEETQLIKAEAALQMNDPATALTAYNAERTAQGMPTKTSVTLADVMTEKYIALFQQIEPWNDYKRTCLPAITPAPGGVPRRLLYPLSTERNANPNIPPPNEQPHANWNDVRGTCP
jgi:hypothetical protein